MNHTAQIRSATNTDTPGILEIYAPFIRETAVSFEETVPAVDEFAKRIRSYTEEFPWLVCGLDARVAGYAYATPYRRRKAYQWTAEVSVYVHPDFQRRRVALALYTALMGLLGLQGICNTLAGIALPNPGSVGFHEAFGFRLLGTYHGVGYKFGKWHDVGWWEYRLHPVDDTPSPGILPVDGVLATGEAVRILDQAAGLIRT